MAINLKKIVSEEVSEGEVYSFIGEITSEKITTILEEVERKLHTLEAVDQKTHKRLFYVGVESIQNLFHHAEGVFCKGIYNKRIKMVAIKILRTAKGFEFITWNFVTFDKIDKIAERIDSINKLTKEDLKEYYKMVLNNSQYSEKGGGGLGMIDIARKAEGRFSYEFKEIQKNLALFRLKIIINSN